MTREEKLKVANLILRAIWEIIMTVMITAIFVKVCL